MYWGATLDMLIWGIYSPGSLWVLNNSHKKSIGKLTWNIVLKFTWDPRLIQTAEKQLAMLLAKNKDSNEDWSHGSVTLNYLYISNTEIHLRIEVFYLEKKKKKRTTKFNSQQSTRSSWLLLFLLPNVPLMEVCAKLKMKTDWTEINRTSKLWKTCLPWLNYKRSEFVQLTKDFFF